MTLTAGGKFCIVHFYGFSHSGARVRRDVGVPFRWHCCGWFRPCDNGPRVHVSPCEARLMLVLVKLCTLPSQRLILYQVQYDGSLEFEPLCHCCAFDCARCLVRSSNANFSRLYCEFRVASLNTETPAVAELGAVSPAHQKGMEASEADNAPMLNASASIGDL